MGYRCRGHWSESSEQSQQRRAAGKRHVLIADENNNRVIEVTRDKEIVFQQGR